MDITLRCSGAMATAFGIMVLGLQPVARCQAQPSTQYIPPPESITIRPRTNGTTVSVTVEVRLPDSCHSVSNWGQPLIVGNVVYVDAQFWWSPWWICLPMVIAVSTNYNLGAFPPGNYTFYFLAWGVQVKAEAFSVPEPGPPRLGISRLSASQARLSWATNATDYSLERAMGLSAPEWTTVTNLPPVIGNEFVLTVDLPGGHGFYRLRRR